MARRHLSELLADLDEAIDASRELIACGHDRWENERPLRLAGEAVIGRIGDVASKLPDQLLAETSEVPWDDVRGMRIVVDHVYHAVDYNIVWKHCAMMCRNSAWQLSGGCHYIRRSPVTQALISDPAWDSEVPSSRSRAQ